MQSWDIFIALRENFLILNIFHSRSEQDWENYSKSREGWQLKSDTLLILPKLFKKFQRYSKNYIF